MKKNLFRLALMLMIGGAIAVACEEKLINNPDDPDNGNSEASGPSVKVDIDGNFADWDQITTDVAGKDDYLAVVSASASDPISVIKTSSDALNVYFYAEILIEALPQNSICSEWGDSYNGTPEKGYKGDTNNDAVGEVFNLFFDPDGKEETGFFTYADGDEAAIPGLGCEQCSQNFMFFNPDLKKLCIAWNQTNVGITSLNGAPYDYNGDFFQEANWNVDGAVPQWGWQNFAGDGKGDNIAPKPENIASKVDGTKVRVEFAIEKADIVNLPDEATEYAWGVCFRNTSEYTQDIGPIRALYSK